MRIFLSGLLYLAVLLLSTGCKTMFSSDSNRSQTPWTNFVQAQAAFDKIIPHQTTVEELKKLGFDPDATSNVKVLNYLDLINRFLPNASVKMEDLQPDVRECIESKDSCHAYELELHVQNGKRYGNLAADMFGFVRKTRITGWHFRGLIIVRNEVVAYKLRSGEPMLERYEKRVKPLGPFQDLESLLGGAPKRWM